MGIGNGEGRGLAELLTNVQNTNGGNLNHSGANASMAVRSSEWNDGDDAFPQNQPRRSPVESLRFALGLSSEIRVAENVKASKGVTMQMAEEFAAKVREIGSNKEEATPMEMESVEGDAPGSEGSREGGVAEPEDFTSVSVKDRLGPDVCCVDRSSITGELLLQQIGGGPAGALQIESRSNFTSCRANVCIISGKWQYEVILGTAGIQQIGWATMGCPFTNEEGVGDAMDSYAYDGKRVRKWSRSCEPYGQPWACGDVIGCCIDMAKQQISFYRNGNCLGVAFDKVRTAASGSGGRHGSMLAYFPAISLSHGERCELNFGSRPFAYPIQGFQALQMPPPPPTISRARFLCDCLGRLATETHLHALSAADKRTVCGNLLEDDAYVAAGLIFEELGPLINDYISEAMLLPLLESLIPTGNALMYAMSFMTACLEKHELKSWVNCTMTSLSRNCRISFYDGESFPYSASYPFLSLACELLSNNTIMEIWITSPDFGITAEGFLTRKQPNSNDLAALMPTVWWLGATDEICSEEKMKSSCNSLSISMGNVETKQQELCRLLMRQSCAERDASNGGVLVAFLRQLLLKNRGAVKNIQPPGLSDNSVLVSAYYVILNMLLPYLENDMPAFPPQIFLRDNNEYFDLARLGGTYNHVNAERPLTDEDKEPLGVDGEACCSSDEPSTKKTTLMELPSNCRAEFIDILVLLYHLGLTSNYKQASQQLQTQLQAINQLDDTDRRILRSEQTLSSRDQLRHLKEARAVFREDVIESVRLCAWHRVGLFSPWKQGGMILACTFLVKVLLKASSRNNLFSYVPELYVENVIDSFHALRRGDPPVSAGVLVEKTLGEILTFMVMHFHDTRIINPDVRDLLLQSISVLLQYKTYVKAFEENEFARENMVRSLLKTFDSRFWIPISNIILRLCKGQGFGKSLQSSNTESASAVYQKILENTCSTEKDLFETFLNKLFNMLNWSITEFTVAFKEIMEIVRRRQIVDMHQQQRKCCIMYELSINLLRILEFFTSHLPQEFLDGPTINLTRLCELLVFILNHTCANGNLFDSASLMQLSALEKINKESILEPAMGLVISLQTWHDLKNRPRDSDGEVHPCMHSLAKFFVDQDCKDSIANLEKVEMLKWKEKATKDASYEKWPIFSLFVEEVQREAARAAGSEGVHEGSDGEVPNEYLDPILMTVMTDPVILPDSQQTIDRATIQRHLMSSQTDPFTRSDLTLAMIKPNEELKKEIDAWSRKRKTRGGE